MQVENPSLSSCRQQDTLASSCPPLYGKNFGFWLQTLTRLVASTHRSNCSVCDSALLLLQCLVQLGILSTLKLAANRAKRKIPRSSILLFLAQHPTRGSRAHTLGLCCIIWTVLYVVRLGLASIVDQALHPPPPFSVHSTLARPPVEQGTAHHRSLSLCLTRMDLVQFHV